MHQILNSRSNFFKRCLNIFSAFKKYFASTCDVETTNDLVNELKERGFSLYQVYCSQRHKAIMNYTIP